MRQTTCEKVVAFENFPEYVLTDAPSNITLRLLLTRVRLKVLVRRDVWHSLPKRDPWDHGHIVAVSLFTIIMTLHLWRRTNHRKRRVSALTCFCSCLGFSIGRVFCAFLLAPGLVFLEGGTFCFPRSRILQKATPERGHGNYFSMLILVSPRLFKL